MPFHILNHETLKFSEHGSLSVGSSKYMSLLNAFPHRIHVLFLSRIILFHDVQRDIPNLEFSPSHVSIGFSLIALPKTVLPKDDRKDFFQEERLDHDFGHLCRGRRIQLSGHSDLGIFNNL